MKKGLLVAILAMLTGVLLVGCGQNQEEQPNEDSSDTVVTEEQKQEENQGENQGENKEEENKDEEKKDEKPQNVDLGEKTVDGESIEGTIYGTGKYRLTKASDRVVLEWVKDNSKNKIEYIFTNDKLSNILITTYYENEEQAKSLYDSAVKNENTTKGLKNLKLDGKTISYEAEESQWAEIKDYSKDQVFDEQKKSLDELSKVDDIKSDD